MNFQDYTLRGGLLVVAVAAISPVAWADPARISAVTSPGRTVTVEAVTDNIIRVRNTAGGLMPLKSEATVLSGTVEAASAGTIGNATAYFTTASGIVVLANTATGEVTINAGEGKTVIDKGLRTEAGGTSRLDLVATSSGSYYGAGERGHRLNLKGDTLTMYNRQNYGYTGSDRRIRQMNITMPLVVSSDGFALLFDDYAPSRLILGEGNNISYITENPRPVDFYFVNGASTVADATEQLTALTGRQPMPPLWSLGYITSKYGYHNEAETRGVVDTLRREGYPLDGLVLDLYWYGKEQDMGRLAWDGDQWPRHRKMLADLKKKGVNVVTISQPYILRNGRGLDNYNTLAEGGMLMRDSLGSNPQEVTIWVGEGGMFDVSNPDTRAWMRERYRSLTDEGVTGWWGDLGEPEVHPETGVHANGLTARLYHNQYGNDWSSIISDLFKEEYPDRRLLTMMRGGTIGLQRYSVFPWSTDVSRSWGGLAPQVTIMTQAGLSGLGYMGHDVGGFAVDTRNPEDAELYVRWLQLGLFSPMLRTHATFKAEPYHYPQYEAIIKRLIADRYRWLPYNYTLAYENATKGYPLVRPLNFTEARSNAYDSISDEFLWGGDVLVAPVMTQGATRRNVTFPQGSWVDFNYPYTRYEGGSTVDYPAPLEVLPLFVRAGAFIPMADYKMSNTGDYRADRFTVNYYPVEGVTSSFTMYDDDRISPSALADGNYRLVTFDGACAHSGLTTIDINAAGTYPGAPSKIRLDFAVKGVTSAPAAVSVNGRTVKSRHDAATATLTFSFDFVPSQNTHIAIQR